MRNGAENNVLEQEHDPTGERKKRHKLTEQRGRQKINNQINDLKELLPECRYVNTTKASVLECAINSLKRFQGVCNQLMIANKKLQDENKYLRAELDKVLAAKSSQPTENTNPASNNLVDIEKFFTSDPNPAPIPQPTTTTSSIDDFFCDKFEPLNNVSAHSSSDSFFEGVPASTTSVDPSTLTKRNHDDFTSSLNSSSPSSSSSFGSPHVSGSSPGSQFGSNESPVDSPDEEDPLFAVVQQQGYFRWTKPRLFLIFLFLLPFCFSVDNVGLPTPATAMSTARNLMSTNFLATAERSLGYYLEVIRLLFYLFWGTMGLAWITNTILWFFKLESKETQILDRESEKRGQFFVTYSKVSL